MCERNIQACVEAAMLLGEMRDAGRISRSDFNEALTELSMITAAEIVDTDNPEASFRAFLAEVGKAKITRAGNA